MERHGTKRSRPADLVPGTLRVIAARMNYLPPARARQLGGAGGRQPCLRFALRARARLPQGHARALQRLADRIAAEIGEFRYRVFTDSAPVMEVELARRPGLGWRGKHTLLLNREAGSYFFLGEIYTDLPLPVDEPQDDHCGTCRKCIDVCPTQAIVAPYQLDARRCISYLTIEHKGSHPGGAAAADRQPRLRLRRLPARLPVEQVRAAERGAGLRGAERARRRERWSNSSRGARRNFTERLAGSAISQDRLRAVAAQPRGRAWATRRPRTRSSPRSHARADHPSALVREHVAWALDRHRVAQRG